MFRHQLSLGLAVLLSVTASWAQQLTVTLSGGMFNGSNVPCFGEKAGTISSAVSGGTAPYTYEWTNGSTSATLTNLAAGYYKLRVKDAVGTEKFAEITLSEPEPLKVFADPFVYPNGKNISCFECFNGSIDVQVMDGTAPYTYVWQDASTTTQDRTGLGAKSYEVIVTDANGCVEKAAIALEQPESNDWKMGGNVGTNPESQYIGTADAKDVVFKANGQESIRLKSNGDISLLGGLNGAGPLVRDASGNLRLGGDDNLPTLQTNDCYTKGIMPYWNSTGNAFAQLCPDFIPRLGTLTPVALDVITNGVTRMVITPEGKVGIGTVAPSNTLTVGSSNSRSVIEIDNRAAGTTASGELRFSKGGTQRWGLGTDFSMSGGQDFYIWDHLAMDDPEGPPGRIRLRIDQEGRVNIGDVGVPEGYRLSVQEGIITERVKVAIANEGEWYDRVFDSGYQVMPLSELEEYILREKHLPDIPSAKELVRNGLDLAKSDAALLKRLEEMTLHVIQMNKHILELEAQLLELKNQ